MGLTPRTRRTGRRDPSATGHLRESVPDRRVRRTRAQLLSALGTLIHEKPYDAIALKEILHRANVGRSTFYTHFGDKDELLAAAMADLLRVAPAATPRCERALRFSLPIFRHVDEHRRATNMGERGRASLHAQLEHEIARVVAAELRGEAPGRVPTELAIRHVTSTFVTVLDWWVDTSSALSPADVDRLFRALVLPALTAVS